MPTCCYLMQKKKALNDTFHLVYRTKQTLETFLLKYTQIEHFHRVLNSFTMCLHHCYIWILRTWIKSVKSKLNHNEFCLFRRFLIQLLDSHGLHLECLYELCVGHSMSQSSLKRSSWSQKFRSYMCINDDNMFVWSMFCAWKILQYVR